MKRGKDYDYAGVENILQEGEKVCTKCKELKSLENFSFDKYHPTGKKSQCRSCSSKRFKAWRDKNIEGARLRDRISQYKSKYGLTEEEATELALNRVGTCEICLDAKPLVVDHCHDSGKVRGRICSSCNSVVGYSKESIETLENTIAYLRKYN